MTAPTIGGKAMAELRHTSDVRRATYQWKVDAGPFTVVATEVTPGNHSSAVYFRSREDIREGSHQTVQDAADAASAYLRGVALEILETVDPEAATRAKCGTCRECKHRINIGDSYRGFAPTCRNPMSTRFDFEVPLDGFCHRFERRQDAKE